MKRQDHTCMDCNCEAVSHQVERHNRHQISEEITFSCGARQRKFQDNESGQGSVEFEGCTCAC